MRLYLRKRLSDANIHVLRFKLATMQMDRVVRQPSSGDIYNFLGTMTSNLDDYYEDSISRISKLEDKNKKVAMLMLTWLVHAKRTLRVVELAHALAIRPSIRSAETHLCSDRRCTVVGHAILIIQWWSVVGRQWSV